MSETFRTKPAWIQSTGLVPARLPEPPAVQRYRGGQRVDVESRFDAATNDSAFDALNRAGVNLVFVRYFAGIGMEFEKSAMERAKDAVLRAHNRGMKAALTIQFGAVAPETLAIEEPECSNWLQVNGDGGSIQGAESYLFRACYNSESYMRLMERVCVAAVDAGADLIAFDNVGYSAEPDTCRCPLCVAAFRESLRNQYGSQDDRTRAAGRERFGHNSFTHIRPPVATHTSAESPLEQEWIKFKTRSVTQCVARLSRAIGKKNPEVAILADAPGILHSSSEAEAGVSLNELAAHIDAVSPNTKNAGAAAKKAGAGEADLFARSTRALGLALIADACTQNVEAALAASLAFNAHATSTLSAEPIGLLNAEWEQQAEQDLELQAVRDALRFFTQNKGALLLGARTLPGVAILRDGPTLAYGGAGAQQFAQAAAALQDAGIPFEFIHTNQIGRIEGLRCIVLPGSECITEDTAKALDSFVLSGGGLVATDGAGRRDIWRRVRTDSVLASLLGPEYPRKLQREAGIGRVAYVPHVNALDAFVDSVRFALGGETPWRVECDSGTPLSRAAKAVSGAIALHVINPDEDALRGLRCSVASERQPMSVTPIAPGKTYDAIPFSYDNGRVSFTFDDVARYVCFKIEG